MVLHGPARRPELDSVDGEKADTCLKTWMKPATNSLIGGTAADVVKSKPDLIAENAFLRQQLIVLKRQVKQPTLSPRDRGVRVLLASRVPGWTQALVCSGAELVGQFEVLNQWRRPSSKAIIKEWF